MKLETFYDEHVDKVYKFFYVKCLDKATAEDLTSDTFIAFMEQCRTQAIDNHKKYLYGIMRNTWLQFLRNKYREALTDIENIEDFASHVEINIEGFDEAENVGNRLLPFINSLPTKQRDILVKKLIEEKTTQEIADEIGKDKNYVKTTYHRALTTLRTKLSQPYLGESL